MVENTTSKLGKLFAKFSKTIKPNDLRKIIAGSIWGTLSVFGMTMANLWSMYSILLWVMATIGGAFGLITFEQRSDEKYEEQRKQVIDVTGQIKKIKLRL